MLFKLAAEGCFSAIAASFNTSLATDFTQLFSPFTRKFWGNFPSEFYSNDPTKLSYPGACEKITDLPDYPYTWNREGGETGPGIYGLLPPNSGTRLCWETNVVTFNHSLVLGSINEVNMPVSFEHGWLKIPFSATGIAVVNGQTDGNGVVHSQAAHSLTSVNGDTYFGLPTVGFMVQYFINQNAAPGILATYGGNFNHKYTAKISRLPP